MRLLKIERKNKNNHYLPMSVDINVRPQVLTLFDQSPIVINNKPRKILLLESENKFGTEPNDFNQSLDYSRDPNINSSSSASSSHNQRKKFSPEEDNLLNRIIAVYGPRKWDQIALSLPGRTGRQCRDRFQNYLRPSLTNGPWTRDEDRLLEAKVFEIGQHWNKIAKFFKGRSCNNIKNRYYTYILKQKQRIFQQLSEKKLNRKQQKCEYNENGNEFNNGFQNNFIYKNYNNNNLILQNEKKNYNLHFNEDCNQLNTLKYLENDNNNINFDFELSKSKNLKKILFPPLCPPNNFILPSNKGLFNFLSQQV